MSRIRHSCSSLYFRQPIDKLDIIPDSHSIPLHTHTLMGEGVTKMEAAKALDETKIAIY